MDTKSLLDEQDPEKYLVTRRAEMAYILRTLKRTHAQLNVSFASTQHVFASIVLDVNSSEGYFLLDELNPIHGHERLLAGQRFSVRASDQGVQIFFSGCKVTEVIQAHDGAMYKVAFPTSMIHHQRREAFRAHVGRTYHIPVRLNAAHREIILEGELLDISSTGCKVEFPFLVTPPFDELEEFDEMEIEVESQNILIRCSAEARYASYLEELETTHCGFRFLQIDGRSQREVDRFVVYLQREARRLGLR